MNVTKCHVTIIMIVMIIMNVMITMPYSSRSWSTFIVTNIIVSRDPWPTHPCGADYKSGAIQHRCGRGERMGLRYAKPGYKCGRE